MDDDLQLTDSEFALALAQAIAEMNDLRSRAPGEIAAAVNTLYEALILTDHLLSDHGYDRTVVPDDEIQALADPAIQEADQRLREYCNFD